MKRDMRGNGASEGKRSIYNNQRQIDCQTKEDCEQGEADLTNDKRVMN